MSQKIYEQAEYKNIITTQSKLDTAISGGTAIEGLPYSIVSKCPEIYGNGAVQNTAPTASTVGAVGDLYIALINNELREWQCTSVVNTTYTWTEHILVPACPTTDGTYTLSCTVAGGVASLSWVSE